MSDFFDDIFNTEMKEQAIANFEEADEDRKYNITKLTKKRKNLNILRDDHGPKTVQIVANYINFLSNSPQFFDNSYTKLGKELTRFKNNNGESINLNALAQQASDEFINKISGGALAGIGIGVLGPAVVTTAVSTFGTASTGVAISGLSGVAAKGATLAWIGGGSLATGGAGIAGGKATLAWLGPIGLGIAAVCAIGAAVDYTDNNKTIAYNANKECKKILKANAELELHIQNTINIIKQTETHCKQILQLTKNLKKNAPKNYLDFNEAQKNELIALKNNIESFSKLLNQAV